LARIRTRSHHAILVGVVVACACAPPRSSELVGRATDEWLRRYTIEPDGQVEIANRDGPIEVQAVEGDTVEIRATRVAHAPTDEAARDLLPRLPFDESADASHVTVRTGRLRGIVIGVRVEVSYRVTVPARASVRLRTSNGAITITGVHGAVVAAAANGDIKGSALAGGVTARTANANAAIELAAFGAEPVDVRATNGDIHLVVPRAANANLLATATNGRTEVDNLDMTPLGEQGPRRVRVRINAGGTPIELSAVNGNIRVEGR
jgi:hypothetical protein